MSPTFYNSTMRVSGRLLTVIKQSDLTLFGFMSQNTISIFIIEEIIIFFIFCCDNGPPP